MRARRLHTAYNISTNRWLLQRYAFIEEQLFTVQAGWIWSTPSFKHKIELGRLAYEDALHANELRRRADELLPATEEVLRPQATENLSRFCNEVGNAETLIKRFVGAFSILKPQLLASYNKHLNETDEITDGPTVVILRRLVAEEEDHIAWGQEVLESLLSDTDSAKEAAIWESHLREAFEVVGRVRGEGDGGTMPDLYNPGPPAVDLQTFPARDGRYRIVPIEEYHVASMGETSCEIVRHLLYQNSYGEMEAEDLLGQVLANAPELPWPMRLDLARQMWDEARHAEMSWRRMEELGGAPDPLPPVPPSILGVIGTATDPFERLLILQRTIEGRVSERHRFRVNQIARGLGDPQTARLFEYIVADERAHVGNSGWIDKLVGDDLERRARLTQIEAVAERTLEDLLSRRVDATVSARPAVQ